ncbi:MAG: RagB/SusD family nutrient uptake outer membrane protein [Tannerellaceae bacterium]|nr:RagB/SusD family nutrient uptake outer membrane protein [Tannerellaceae bacterium]
MKINKLHLIILLTAVSITTFTSCEDFLKETPYSFVGPKEVGNDNSAVALWVTGVYSKWADDMFRWGNFPRVLDMDCDYVSGPDWAFSNLGAGNFQGDDVSNTIWTGGYNLINRANVAIKYINEITGADERVKANGLGEVYFHKAFVYFMLVRAYGEIPLLDVAISEGASYNQPRKSIPEVYTEIIRLLEEAIPRLYKNTETGYQAGHVCAGTAVGLLAKVYATMASAALPAGEEITVKTGSSFTFNGDEKVLTLPLVKNISKTQVKGYENFDWKECYQKAAQWAGYLLHPGAEHPYGTHDLLDYNELWSRSGYAKSTEHLFSLHAKNGDELYGNSILEWYNGVENGQGVIQNGLYIGNRFHWYSLFDNEDLRVRQGVKHRFIYSYQVNDNNGFYYPNTPEYRLMATGYDSNGNKVADPVAPYNDGRNYYYNVSSECLAFTNKYADVTDVTQKKSDAYWPFLRMADIILIYAEAQCELNQQTEAIQALNKVRNRSNARPATTTGSGAITTKTELRSAIFEERAKELSLEGDRRWDLIRWGIYLEVMNSIGGTNQDGSSSNYDEAGVNKHREQRHLLYPLPSSEVSTNEAINSNNPGWS